jgi:hypothetical protein
MSDLGHTRVHMGLRETLITLLTSSGSSVAGIEKVKLWVGYVWEKGLKMLIGCGARM